MVKDHKIYQRIVYNKLKIAGYDQSGHARYVFKNAFKEDFDKISLEKAAANTGIKDVPFHSVRCLPPQTVQELL